MRRTILILIFIAYCLPTYPQTECTKDRSRWLLWGQYVQSNQLEIDWSAVRESLCSTPYNGYSIHLLSPWGNPDNFYPWPLTEQGYDLSKSNPKWFAKLREFAIEIGGKGNMILSIAFFDRYFETKWNASKMHPFRMNTFGFNWGDSAEPLYDAAQERDSRSWNRNSWISWKTQTNRRRNISEFRFNKTGRAFRTYIINVISVLNEVKKQYPDLIVVYRLFNEERARAGKSMTIESGTTLESSVALTEVIQDLWKEHGTAFRPGHDLFPALDWSAFKGTELQLDWVRKTNRTLRELGWLQEIHGCSSNLANEILAIPKIDSSIIIFSTDGLQPEEHPYFTRESRALYNMNLPKLDLKVPNKMAEYFPGDFHRTFSSVLPVMMNFTSNTRTKESQ